MIPQPITNTVRLLALAGGLSLFATATGHAAFADLPSPTAEFPGVLLDANTTGLTGTVLSVMDSPFTDNALPDPFAQGTLRSFVVDRGAGMLDFYYQLVNTSPVGEVALPDSDFYRLKTTGSFDQSLVISIAQTNDLSGLTAGAGSGFVAGSFTTGAFLKPATTGDRDVGTIGSIGFDFPAQPPIPFIDDPKNIGPGQSSAFFVVRTNSTSFAQVEARISGAATSFATTFTAVPEPGSILFGLALIGSCLGRSARIARRRAA